MWPFYSRKERARRSVLRSFSPYLSPEAVDMLVRTPDTLRSELKRAMVSYIILQVRDDDLAEVPHHLDRACGAVIDAGGTITSIMSSFVAVAFGIPVHAPSREHTAQRDQAMVRLHNDLGSNMRAIFGSADSLFGTVGTARMSYQALIPDVGGRLERLLRLEFGTSAEL